MEHTKDEKRTAQQNKALHKAFNDISDLCLSHGWDLQYITAGKVDISVTPEVAKSLFKQIALKKFGKYKTSELSKNELQEVWTDYQFTIQQNTGAKIDFPSIETLLLNLRDYE